MEDITKKGNLKFQIKKKKIRRSGESGTTFSYSNKWLEWISCCPFKRDIQFTLSLRPASLTHVACLASENGKEDKQQRRALQPQSDALPQRHPHPNPQEAAHQQTLKQSTVAMWAQHNNRNLSKWKQETEEEVRVTQCGKWPALKTEEGRSP